MPRQARGKHREALKNRPCSLRRRTQTEWEYGGPEFDEMSASDF
eukprot:COSAG06_NODE_33821_length_483_cov_6.804688_2_plen_43_part_01